MKSALFLNARDRMQRARELQAEALFMWDRVIDLISVAASRGDGHVVLIPEHSIELSKTEPAKALCERLSAQGFAISWVRRRPALSLEKSLLARGDGAAIEVGALEVRWDTEDVDKLSLPRNADKR